jgi:site-specific DNA-methyltransferase (adenine-specific)
MMDVEGQVERWEIGRLRRYAKNAKRHPDRQIKALMRMIQRVGFRSPIQVDEEGEIIAGHGRLTAAEQLGMVDVPVLVQRGLTSQQKRELRLADNRLAELAETDEALLLEELEALGRDGSELWAMGFEELDLRKMLGDAHVMDEDSVPDVPTIPTTRNGDLWLLDEHRVMCGDSISVDAVGRLMDGCLADLLLTDPPYNVAYEGKTADALKIENDSMTDEDFQQFLRKVYMAADAVMKPGSVFYVWHSDSKGYDFRRAANDVGWQVRQCLIWNKNSMVLGRQDYHCKHEPCLYGWKGGAAHFWGSDRTQTTVLDFNRPTRSSEHPTMKPVDLFKYQIENSTKKGGLVLDLFGGSGTTVIAAHETGRRTRLMELDTRYVDVIVRRWQDFTGKAATLDGDGRTFDEVSNARLMVQDAT